MAEEVPVELADSNKKECTMQYVPSVVDLLKFLSNHQATDLYYVKVVIQTPSRIRILNLQNYEESFPIGKLSFFVQLI
jgi:hypothetical protein